MAWCFALKIQRCLYEKLPGIASLIVSWRHFLLYMVSNCHPCNLKRFKGYFGSFLQGDLTMYLIQTATQEFTIPDSMLDKIINQFWFDEYQVLDDDTDTMLFEDVTGNSPTMVYKKIRE